MQFKVKDFLTQYFLTEYWLGYQRLAMMDRIAKGHRDLFTDQKSRVLLALYDETAAGLDQLPEVERTILTRQYIEGEYQPIVRDELGLKVSAYYRRQVKARRHLADALNEAPTFQRLEISFIP
ncbi:hypothetical protein [Limosilactobacillus fermentum]|uniref:hypothetical protein n=1 Tax=Limosilactobacillus fermentum TaxID=1613 RepID=UPI002F266349